MSDTTTDIAASATPPMTSGGRSLRNYAREVGSIVLGVLIALGLGEVANDIKIRGDVASARRAISAELGKTVGQGIERVRIAACVNRKLDALARIVDGADRTGRLPPVGTIGAPPIWAWSSAVWDRGVSAETLAHFGTAELSSLPNAFELVPTMREYNQREYDVWAGFNVIVGPGRAVTTQEIAELRKGIVEARSINTSMAAIGRTAKRLAEDQGVAYDPVFFKRYSERTTAQSPICQPIGNRPPAIYGLAPETR